jgi:hypothetical protein
MPETRSGGYARATLSRIAAGSASGPALPAVNSDGCRARCRSMRNRSAAPVMQTTDR